MSLVYIIQNRRLLNCYFRLILTVLTPQNKSEAKYPKIHFSFALSKSASAITEEAKRVEILLKDGKYDTL